jgi:glycosyltransferase involved in cell wall biosynthesis
MYSTHDSMATPSLETGAALKVLLVHNSYRQPGGEDQVVNAEADLLRSHGHEVLLYQATNADIQNPLTVLGQVVWNQTSFRELRALVQQSQPDVVHVHNTFPVISPAALYAAAEERIPVVHTLHNYRLLCPAATLYRDGHVCEDCVDSRNFLPAVLHACYRQSRLTTAAAAVTLTAHRLARSWQRHVAAYIALTEFARQKFVESGFDRCKMYVKPNFIRLDPGMGSGTGGYALFVGRLTEEKGIATLLRAWKQLGDRFRLEIIGEGPLSSDVKAAQLTMPNLRWHGWLPKDQVLARMQRANMLIMPSEWYEGFPVTLLEAFATGLPAIVSHIGSLAGLVAEEKTGVQFETGNAAELAGKIRFLFANPELLSQMRLACREEYEKKYTAEANYAILSGIYSAVLNGQYELSGPFRQPQGSPVKSERTGKTKVVVSAPSIYID